MPARKKKIGRPKAPPKQLRDGVIHVRVSPEERAIFEELAARYGLDLAPMIRMLVRRERDRPT